MAAFIGRWWDGSLSTPIAQAGGELVYRFLAWHRLSKQSFKVINGGDTLLSGEFLEGRRRGALGSGRPD
jgi:hypothetical protein